MPTSLLFICLGNICRSPLAEGIFLHHVNRRGVADRFDVDSAGTGGWHAGERADPRARAVAEAHGIVLPSRARQVERRDFERFDRLVCMDRENRRALLAMGAPAERTSLLLSFDPDAGVDEVPDPYYGGDAGFSEVFDLVHRATERLLDALLADKAAAP